jgi:uncharacterized Zn-finger protein
MQSLQEHCQAKHGGRGCFNCVLCDKDFMTKLSYRRHMNTHGGKKGAVCDVSLCQVRMNENASYMEH